MDLNALAQFWNSCWHPFESDVGDGMTEPMMDPDIWKRHVPEEVIHTILAWLPIRSFCKLRTVCRSWNAAPKNPSFRSICARVPSPPPFWIVFACGGPLVFDSSASTWHVASCFLSYDSFTRDAILEASGSLLFYRNFDPFDRIMYVFNPMSKYRRRIPPMIKMEHCYFMGMVLDKQAETYKIFAVDQSFREFPGGSELLRLQLYDSEERTWAMCGSLLKDAEDTRDERRHEMQGATFWNGSLYCLTERLQDEYEDDNGHGLPLAKSYHIYQVGPVAWKEVEARVPIDLCFPLIFENSGRLLLGGGIGVWIGLLSVNLWQLDEVMLEWVEIWRMPQEFVKELGAESPIVFVANGDYIGVASGRHRRILRYMCDLTKGIWWTLPSEYAHILLHRLEGVTSSGTLLFEPRLDATFDSDFSQVEEEPCCSSASSSEYD